jgi:hypothetical protein
MTRRLLAAALCVAATAALAAPVGAAGGAFAAPGHGAPAQLSTEDDGSKIWSVRPAGPDGKPDARTHYTLQATPGTTLTDHVLVTNLSKSAVSFSIYGTDAFNTSTGAFDLLSGDKQPVDLGSWMSFPYKAVNLSAGGTVAVPFQVLVPKTATPGDHAGGVVVSLYNPATAATGSGKVNVDTRVAVRAYLRVPGNLVPRLGIGEMTAAYRGSLNPFAEGTVDVSYTLTNPGNIRLRSHPTITVSGPFGTIASLTPEDLPELLPAQHATFTNTLHGVYPEGPLTVTVKLQPYADELQPVGQKVPQATGSVDLWVVPWTLLILIVGLVLLVVLVWWLRRRRILRLLDSAIRTTDGPGKNKPKAQRDQESNEPAVATKGGQ